MGCGLSPFEPRRSVLRRQVLSNMLGGQAVARRVARGVVLFFESHDFVFSSLKVLWKNACRQAQKNPQFCTKGYKTLIESCRWISELISVLLVWSASPQALGT